MIQRYIERAYPHPRGDWVRFEDHERELAALSAEVARLRADHFELSQLHAHSVGFWEPKLGSLQSSLAEARALLGRALPFVNLTNGARGRWCEDAQAWLAANPECFSCGVKLADGNVCKACIEGIEESPPQCSSDCWCKR